MRRFASNQKTNSAGMSCLNNDIRRLLDVPQEISLVCIFNIVTKAAKSHP